MKKIYYILLSLILPLAGCGDFLDQDNKSNVLTKDFYSTKSGFVSLMNSTYSSMRSVYGKEPWIFSAGTDLYASGRNKVPDGLGGYKALINTDSDVSNFYTNCYKGIQLANTAIYYADHTEEADYLAQYKSEARFIRAYYYYLLVQHFGGVPINMEMIDATPIFSFEQKSAEDIYTFVLTEMEASLVSLPAKTKVFGRIDQRTVNHFIAKTYLCRGYETFGSVSDFQKAAQYADLAIGGQALSLGFNSLFSPNNQDNEEVIWSVQYSKNSIEDPSNDGNMQQSFFGTYLGGSEDGHKYTTSNLTPTLRLHQLFTEGDARYSGTFMVQLYNKYYDFYKLKEADLANDKVLYYYPPAWAVADTATWRAANPATRSKTIIIPMQENTLTTSGKKTTYRAAMTGDVYGVACVRKFDDPESKFSTKSSTRDIVLARLGETYLIAAEAYFKAGDVANAVARINVVRSRAAEPGYDLSVKSSDLSIDFILDERARELAGEYHRWMDLKRTGKLVEYCVKYNPDVPSADYFKGTDGQNKILRPIPLAAINLNQAPMKQNPGY